MGYPAFFIMKSINKIFNNIKLELFFIRQLAKRRYSLRYWVNYFKNRFFGNYLFRYLPRCEYVADPDLELHTICSRHGRGLWMFAWMLYSFLFYSKLRPLVIVHDDGTLNKSTAELIQSKFANVKIMFRDHTTKQILEMPNVPEIIKLARRRGHFFLDRLINIMIFSKAKKIIVTDVDVLYYKPPVEVMDFVAGKTSYDALVHREPNDEFNMMVDEDYAQKHEFKKKQIALMNGGYMIVNKEKISINQLVEYLEHTKRPLTDYFVEMGGWAYILGQLNFIFLPVERYAIKGFVNDKMVLKHYTSPRRHEMFAYGIDLVREKIGMKFK